MFVSLLEQIFTIYSKHETGLFNYARSWHLSRNLPAEIAPISGKYVSGTTATCMSSQDKKPSVRLRSHGSLSTCVSVCLATALMAQCAEPWEISRAVKRDSKNLKQTSEAQSHAGQTNHFP